MKLSATKFLAGLTMMLPPAFLSSCVHEWPEAGVKTGLRLTVRHDKEWTDYDYDTEGTRAEETWKARYVFRVYSRGMRTYPVLELTEMRDDLSLADFTAEFSLPEGNWDIYVWQDFVEQRADRDVIFHDVTDFSAITYTDPYVGDTDRRDTFEGMVSVDVESSIDIDYQPEATINMTRPVAKYVFIATDFDKFLRELQTRGSDKPVETAYPTWGEFGESERNELMQGYSVVGLYPFFMPAVYNTFTRKVIDSRRSVSYSARIRPIDDKHAAIAMDYVHLDPIPGSAQVSLGLRQPNGEILQMTGTITIPLKRSQCTYIYGPFLTTEVGSGIDIDFSFSGDFNIKI